MHKLLVAALLVPTLCYAEPATLPSLRMEATARVQVANDEMVAVLAAERVGPTVGVLNDAVMTALNDAIKEAKAIPRINVRLGSFSTNPNWETSKQTGWNVRGEVVLTSSDMKALAILVGKLGQTLRVEGVSFRLSDKSREAEERLLVTKAAANFKEKADTATKAFGFSSYSVRELQLSQSGAQPVMRPMMASMVMKSGAASMPSEGGESDVAVTVSGLVSLNK